MVFESKKENLIIKEYPNGIDRHIYLKRELSEAVETVKAVYENEFGDISYNTIYKIAIHFLISNLEGLNEEEAVKLLNAQHKEIILL